MDPAEIADVMPLKNAVIGKEKRAALFYHYVDGTREIKQLEDAADCSHQAAYNALDAFEEFSLINRDRNELTEKGDAVADRIIPFLEEGYALQRLSPLLNRISPGGNQPLYDNIELFRRADIFEPVDSDAEVPFRPYRDLIWSADRCRELVPFRTAASGDFRRAVVQGGLDAEFVVAESIIDAALSDEETLEAIEEMREAGASYVVYQDAGFPGFSLSLFDTEVVGLAAVDDGFIFVQHSGDEVIDWGEALYEEFREAAIPLDEYR